MPKRSNKINKGTNAGSNLSERLMKLSDSKSYMFLGRRNSDSSTPGTKITKGNSSSNNSRHGNTNNNNSKNIHNKSDNTIHTSTTKTSLYRDDYLFFEIYQEQQQEGEQEEGGDEQKAEAGAGDDIPNYTIMYHNWTLRQLYRHVVSSIKVAKDSNSNTNTNTNVNTTTRTSNIGTTTVNNNDNINKPSAIHRRSRSASVGSSNSAIFPPPPPPPPLPSITNDNNSKPHHRRQVSTSSATNGRRHGHHHHHNENHHISRPLEPKLLGSNLHPRDMRRLVTPFSASNEPELIVRRHVIVFNFDPLRAIITRDRLLVLVPSGADSILKNLEERIVGNNMEEIECYYDDDEDDDNDDIENDLITNNNTNKRQYVDEESVIEKAGGVKIDDESDLLGNIFNDSDMGEGGDTYDDTTYDDDDDDDWSNIMAMDDMDQQTDLTFELLCVNACLATVFEMLADDTEELEEKGLKYVQNRIIGGNNNNNSNNNSNNSRGFFGRIMNNSQNNNIVRPEDALAVIRNLKNATKVMQARVKGFVQSLTRILNEDEDMALMNVSRLISHPQNFIQPVSIAQLEIESDEPELVLESNLHNALTLSNALDLIQGQVDTARYVRTYDF